MFIINETGLEKFTNRYTSSTELLNRPGKFLYFKAKLRTFSLKLHYLRNYRSDDNTHGLRVLVCEEGQQSCEGAESSCEQDEKGQLLLGVDRHLMEGWKEQIQFLLKNLQNYKSNDTTEIIQKHRKLLE